MAKKICVIYGNCLAFAMAKVLRDHEPFTRHFEILPLRPVYEMSRQDAAELADKMQDVSLLIGQDVSWTYLPPGTRGLMQLMGASSETYLFQVAWFNAYNPDMFSEDSGPFGAYHSKIIKDAFDEGLSEKEALARFEHPADKNYVLRNLESNIDELRRREATINIGIADEIELGLQSSKLFHTLNHPASSIQYFIIDSILAEIGLPRLEQHTRAKWSHLLSSEQWPLNEGVHRALRLKFDRPERFFFDGAYYEAASFVEGNYAYYRKQAAVR